jgi:hypothetical protein
MSALVLSPEELEHQTLFLHSDVWPHEDGSCVWSADHPSGWTTTGQAENMAATYVAIRVAFLDALRESGYEVDEALETLVVRVREDAV